LWINLCNFRDSSNESLLIVEVTFGDVSGPIPFRVDAVSFVDRWQSALELFMT
jgi:hypothetical protein